MLQKVDSRAPPKPNSVVSSHSFFDPLPHIRYADGLSYQAKSRKYQGIFEDHSPEKYRQCRENYWPQQVGHMQVPNWTEPGVRRSKRPLSACYTRRKCSMETSHKPVKGRVQLIGNEIGIKSDRWRVVSSLFSCIWSGYIMSFSIRERGISLFWASAGCEVGCMCPRRHIVSIVAVAAR